MRPILIQWRGVTIKSYSAMLYLGLVSWVMTTHAAAHAAGVDTLRVFVASCVLMVPALIGARAFYALSHLYRRDARGFWDRKKGGAAQYGALAAVPLSVPLLVALGLPFGVFWDLATFGILSGMIFVRVGCLMHGCCAGRPSHTRFGVSLPNVHGTWEKRIPSQALEAFWVLALLICAIAGFRSVPFPGALCLLAAAGYAAGRILLLPTREMHPGPGRHAVAQAASLALLVLSLAALTVRWLG